MNVIVRDEGVRKGKDGASVDVRVRRRRVEDAAAEIKEFEKDDVAGALLYTHNRKRRSKTGHNPTFVRNTFVKLRMETSKDVGKHEEHGQGAALDWLGIERNVIAGLLRCRRPEG